jgi:hypothetical protein
LAQRPLRETLQGNGKVNWRKTPAGDFAGKKCQERRLIKGRIYFCKLAGFVIYFSARKNL